MTAISRQLVQERLATVAPSLPTWAAPPVMLAPAGIPEPVARLLEREVQTALRQPDIIERLRAMDTTALGLIGPEVPAHIRADREAWAERTVALRPGDPRDPGTGVGPLISPAFRHSGTASDSRKASGASSMSNTSVREPDFR